jgi:hypothetical protein
MHQATQVTLITTKTTVVCATVAIPMTKLVKNGLNVSETVEYGFSNVWKTEHITSSPIMPAFNIAYLLFIHSIL